MAQLEPVHWQRCVVVLQVGAVVGQSPLAWQPQVPPEQMPPPAETEQHWPLLAQLWPYDLLQAASAVGSANVSANRAAAATSRRRNSIGGPTCKPAAESLHRYVAGLARRGYATFARGRKAFKEIM